MLSTFDWIRLCNTGAELIATLNIFQGRKTDRFPEEKALAGPTTLFDPPCFRCWMHAVDDERERPYCRTCHDVITESKRWGRKSTHTVVVWGHVNQLPKQLELREGFYEKGSLGAFVLDENHFMLLIERYQLKPWLQELLLYHGSELKGLIQLLPTTGMAARESMNDLICRAVLQDSRFPMNMLRIRFFSRPFQLFAPHKRDNEGLLTFDVNTFLEYLQMAFIFKSLLRPEDQQLLRELIELENPADGRFQWGRFTGSLQPEARDMIDSWNIRSWSQSQVTLIYELLDYVEYVPLA